MNLYKLLLDKIKEIPCFIRKNCSGLLFLVLLVAVVDFALGAMTKNLSLILIAVLLIWIHNVLFSFSCFRKLILYFMFHFTFFLFMIGRPIIGLFRGDDWVTFGIENYGATFEGTYLTLCVIFLSLLFIWIGVRISQYVSVQKNRLSKSKSELKNAISSRENSNYFLGMYSAISNFAEKSPEERIGDGKGTKKNWKWSKANTIKNIAVRRIALLIFIAAVICKFILEIEKGVFILNTSYVTYYKDFRSQLPYIIYVGSTFMFYSLCFCLATLPNKKSSTFLLIIYVATTIPTFIVGERSKFVLAVLFTFVYYVLRDYMNPAEQWIGKKEKVVIILGCVFGPLLLGMMNYLRAGQIEKIPGPLATINDFIMKQGVSFSWVCSGMGRIDILRSQGVTSYTFGGIIDYILHGSFAQKLFHATSLGNGNSVLMATQSNSMAHHMSYLILGDHYLLGNGTGTSYLIEVFADFGILGIIIFNLLLGVCLGEFVRVSKKAPKCYVVALCMVSGILFMPRGEAIGLFEFLWRIPFWLTVLVCIGGAYVLSNSFPVLRLKKRTNYNS